MACSVTAPIVTCSRLRMHDGDGITTLVCFHGCPLRCKYCLNPFTLKEDTRFKVMTPPELYELVKKDNLYFIATGGGVTFGGGEPLLRTGFIKEFTALADGWHFCAETSLNVPPENIETAASCIDFFIVDCKDTNSEIYKAYTGCDNKQMLENLKLLLQMVGPDRIQVRLPLIPEYNTEAERTRSQTLLKSMGITQFDLFTYKKETDSSSLRSSE